VVIIRGVWNYQDTSTLGVWLEERKIPATKRDFCDYFKGNGEGCVLLVAAKETGPVLDRWDKGLEKSVAAGVLRG